MRYLTNENDTNVFKASDSSETIRLSARNDNEPVTWDSDDVAKIHIDKDKAHVKDIDATLIAGSNNVTFSTSELADLPAGDYQLELWTKLSDGVNAIWPSQGMLEFTIDRNADSLEGGAVTVITLDDFKKQLNDAISEAEKKAVPGKSAYEEWLDAGNKGSKEDFLKSLKGEKGDGGDTGQPGPSGESAYQLAVDNGFKGTEKEWLDYLRKGPVGADGKSAYKVWLDAGNKGTETDFLNSLVGPRGAEGPAGKPGHDGQQGPQGIPGKDGSTPTLKIGTITSVDPDQPANADLIDNKNGSYTLNLTLPRGAKGETGGINQVVKPELTIGTVQTIASDQSASANLTKTGETSYAINLNIPSGKQGEPGTPGKDGSDGKNGVDGKNGQPGKSAYELAVEQGFKGDLTSWLSGLKGKDGQPGPAGPAGKDGERGPQGIQGPAGPAGKDGERGPQGIQGPAGPAGKDGERGPQGIQGPAGPAGRDGKDASSNITVKNGMVSFGDQNLGVIAENWSDNLHQSDFSYSKDMSIRIIPQANFKTWTGYESGNWTLDVDNNTLTNDSESSKKIKLMTGLYLLRDMPQDIKVVSSSKLGLGSDGYISQITQLIVTPYMVLANAVVSESVNDKFQTVVEAFWRPNWDSDYMPYFGVKNDWRKL